MKRYTSFKIGGPADQIYQVKTLNELTEVLKTIKSAVIIGNGSNVLVSDAGIRDNVIITTGLNRIDVQGNRVICECGAELSAVAEVCCEYGLTGLEFATGIPGTIGGAVYMNAGAFGSAIDNVVETVETMDFDCHTKVFQKVDCEFGYRRSLFQDVNCIITRVTLVCTVGNRDEIKKQMNDYKHRRESKQPLEYPSAGSTFKRPVGYYAGTLIESAGLKGVKIGGAQVSDKHAGFIINTGDATARDVLDLIKLVQKRVYEVHGVKLEPEIRYIGELD